MIPACCEPTRAIIGAIGPLMVTLMSSSSARAQERAAWTLWSLADGNAANVALIIAVGAVQCLSKLSTGNGGNKRAKMAAARCLLKLKACDV